jgi:hypothetical protein
VYFYMDMGSMAFFPGIHTGIAAMAQDGACTYEHTAGNLDAAQVEICIVSAIVGTENYDSVASFR